VLFRLPVAFRTALDVSVLTVFLTVSTLTESISLTDGVILPTMEVFLVSLIVGQPCFSELFPRLLKTLAV